MDAPVILLEKAILLMDDEKDTEALTLFEEVYQIDETSDFGIEAKNYIDFLQAKKILQAQETNSGTNISITDDTDEVPWWR